MRAVYILYKPAIVCKVCKLSKQINYKIPDQHDVVANLGLDCESWAGETGRELGNLACLVCTFSSSSAMAFVII